MVYEGQNYFKNNIPIYLNIAYGKDEQSSQIHSHDFIEIAYVGSGKGYHLVGGKSYPVAKGDLFIINTNVPHRFIAHPDPSSGLMIFNCIFIPEFIHFSLLNTSDFKDIANSILFNSFFLEDGPVITLHLHGTEQAVIEEYFKEMQQEYFNTPKGYVNILRSLLIQMLTKIFRFLETESSHCGKIIHHKTEIINEAINFLKSNYGSYELNINETAVRTFLSPSYFSKLFKEVTGRNFSEYLQDIRISAACNLLRNTEKKVIEIMADVGFKDMKHFNRLFKKIIGKTPSEYRRGT